MLKRESVREGNRQVMSRKVRGIIFLYILLAVGLITVEVFVFKGILSSDSFTGAIIGGALGGLGTLLAVYFTVKDSRETLEEQIVESRRRDEEQAAETRRRDETQRRINFVNAIAELIGSFEADQGIYFWNSFFLDEKQRLLNQELAKLDDKAQSTKKIEIITEEIMRMRFSDNTVRSAENRDYFLLVNRLKGITEAEELLKVVKDIHREEGSKIHDFVIMRANAQSIDGKDAYKLADEWQEESRDRLYNAYDTFRENYLAGYEQT